MSSRMAKRKSVAVPYAEVAQALDMLPGVVGATVLVKYEQVNFKRSPVWIAGQPYCRTLSRLLDFTGGQNIKQSSLLESVRSWAQDNGLSVDVDVRECERAAYRLRAMVSQLGHHKALGRPVPAAWQRHFSALYAKIEVYDDEVQIIVQAPVQAPVPEIIDLLEDDSSSDVNGEDLFSSDNPALARLLKVEAEQVEEGIREELYSSSGSSSNIGRLRLRLG